MSGKWPDKWLDDFCRAMKAKGFYMYRQYFMWGESPAFRNEAGDQHYFLERVTVEKSGEDGHTCELRLMNGSELHAHLRDVWRPVASDEVAFFCNQMDSHFSQIPLCPPWDGPLPTPVKE